MTDVAKKLGRGFGERRVFIIRQITPERSLGHELDHNVNDGRDDEREISGPGNGPRRIFHFTARDQGDFNSNEGKH